jgi:hypothetical protein
VQGAEPTTTDLLDKRNPPVGYELSGRLFVARETGGRKQGFKEGKNIGHYFNFYLQYGIPFTASV